MTAPLFFWIVEVTATLPSGPTTTTIRASDIGYRTRASDVGGEQSYPPLVSEAFQIDREVALDPTGSGASYAWGSIRLSNTDGRFDTYVANWNVDRRTARILYDVKTRDDTNGRWIDPSYNTSVAFHVAFSGLAGSWFLGSDVLDVPLRDALSWLDRPIQSTLYAGTGTYEGPTSLTGTPKPKARGGTLSNPIANITPVLIDTTNLIYQYTDGPGTVVNLYEGGAPTILFSSDTTNLYVGTTSAGHYRTDNSRGLFQLGSVPASGYAITADVTGAFPVNGGQTRILPILRYLIQEECALSTSSMDLTQFASLGGTYSYFAGVYFGPQAINAASAISQLFAGINMRLVPRRNGTLRPIVLAVPATTSGATATLNTTNIISLSPVPLPDSVAPTPYRFRLGYNHNYTVQTSGINTTSSTAAHRQFVQTADSYATWTDATILANFAHPNDPDPVPSAVLLQADAQSIVNSLGALWGVQRQLFEIEVPLRLGLGVDIGDTVSVTYPTGSLRSGVPGLVIGDRVTSTGATLTLRVLI